MVTRNGKLLFPLLAGALVLGACDSGSGSLDGGPTAGATSTLSIQLTDAPGDLKEAWIKIDKVVLQGTESNDSTSGRQEFTVQNAGWVDLIKLAGGKVQDLVNGATIKPGTYSQVRLIVSGVYIRTNGNEVYATSGAQLPAGVTAKGEMKCPSCSTSGLKVEFPGGVKIDGTNAGTLVIDFDVNQSFAHEAGKSGMWVMKPVLRAAKKGGDDHNESTGEIEGKVALAQGVTIPACGGQTGLTLAKFVPTATSGTTVKTGVVRENSEYKIAAVAPGTYTLGVDRVGFANGDTLTFTATADPRTVTVKAGEDAKSNYSVTGATCKKG